MNDWKSQLAELYKGYSTQQKNTKGELNKFDKQENFKGKKGFNDTGIPLTPKAAKKQQRNRSNYRYPMHLQRINEKRTKDAQERWGIKPAPPARSSISERHGNRLDRWIRPERVTYDDAPPVKKRKYSYYGESLDDDLPKEVIYILPPTVRPEPVYRAKVIKVDGKIKFKNKLEEAIYNHPDYLKQKF